MNTRAVELGWDNMLVVIDQKPFPKVPPKTKKNMLLDIMSTKWQHSETEWVASVISEFAYKNGEWCLVPWKWIERIAKRRHGLHKFEIDIELFNMAATGDIEITVIRLGKGIFTRNVIYVKPLPKLGKTIANALCDWRLVR